MKEVIIAIICSGALSTLISQLFTLFMKRAEKKSGVNEGMRLILKDRLRTLCVHYVEQGWIYEDELEDLIRMHSCYHDKLNGNGYLDELMRRVKQLPIHGIGV